MRSTQLLNTRNLTLLCVAFVSGVLMSPKWMMTIMPWIHFAILVRFYRDNNWKGFLLSVPVLAIAAAIAQYGVVPLPLVPFILMMLIGNIIGLLPFIIDRYGHQKLPAWAATLLLPAVYTLCSYGADMGPQGTWSNLAYTQYHFSSLMQITSITGIYGINFLMLWAATTINHWYENKKIQPTISAEGKRVSMAKYLMPISFVSVLLFGVLRLSSNAEPKSTVEVASITLENWDINKEMYRATFDKEIEIPKHVSQSDPILAEIQKGMMAFMADPTAQKYQGVLDNMDSNLAQYLDESRKAAQAGAKIITWSEAAIQNIKSRENHYALQAAQLADELDIYLFFPTAVFHPEKVGKEDLFMENKVLTFDPNGEIVNEYFKNIPVMGIEPSFPGDGTIPTIETPYGNLSPIICYDADHPHLIAQVSDQPTDVLVVPTGDWKAISPYHTYMAAVRCIENGVSMLKSTSNGLSAVIDDRGRILASYDYFDDKKVKTMIAAMPVQSSDTLYAKTAPLFILGLTGLAGGLLLWLSLNVVLKRSAKYRVEGVINA